jgi:heme-degrading monooxygenase HmoA
MSTTTPPFLTMLDSLKCRRACLRAMGLGIAASLLGRNATPTAAGQTARKAIPEDKSVQLHIYIEAKPGKGPDLERLYHSAYVPAIKVQEGFLWSRLLRQCDSNNQYEIDISFKTEKQRAAWAQSKEHQTTWPRIEELGAKITWQGFDVLA